MGIHRCLADPFLADCRRLLVALHYAVLPLRLENDELIVGSEDGIDPVSLAALTRKVGRKVRYVIVLRGQIVTGLRHWYTPTRSRSAGNVVQCGSASVAHGTAGLLKSGGNMCRISSCSPKY